MKIMVSIITVLLVLLTVGVMRASGEVLSVQPGEFAIDASRHSDRSDYNHGDREYTGGTDDFDEENGSYTGRHEDRDSEGRADGYNYDRNRNKYDHGRRDRHDMYENLVRMTIAPMFFDLGNGYFSNDYYVYLRTQVPYYMANNFPVGWYIDKSTGTLFLNSRNGSAWIYEIVEKVNFGGNDCYNNRERTNKVNYWQ